MAAYVWLPIHKYTHQPWVFGMTGQKRLPFHRVWSERKYDEMGASAKETLNAMSLARAPLMIVWVRETMGRNRAYPCAALFTALGTATFSLMRLSTDCTATLPHTSTWGMASSRSSSLAPPGSSLRREPSDLPPIKFPQSNGHSNSGRWLTWLDLRTWERDVLVLSTLLKVLLFPS